MGRAKPILDQLNIVSANVDASVAFYRRLGAEIPEQAIWRTESGAHHVSGDGEKVDLEIDSVAFAQIWKSGWRGRDDLQERVVIGFRLDSREAVDEAYAELTGAGYPGLQVPCDAFWGARFAIVEDPDGLAVGLTNEISPEMKSRPPKV